MNKKFAVNVFMGENVVTVATDDFETALDTLIDASGKGISVDVLDMETGEVLAYQNTDSGNYLSDVVLVAVLAHFLFEGEELA